MLPWLKKNGMVWGGGGGGGGSGGVLFHFSPLFFWIKFKNTYFPFLIFLGKWILYYLKRIIGIFCLFGCLLPANSSHSFGPILMIFFGF